jgi:hypothetical protein
MSVIQRTVNDKVQDNGQRPRKYNNPKDLDELCRGFLVKKDEDQGAAIEYCKNFLSVLSEKPPVTGAVVSSRVRSR